eukprot:2011376-Prymnesium_polylepis.1
MTHVDGRGHRGHGTRERGRVRACARRAARDRGPRAGAARGWCGWHCRLHKRKQASQWPVPDAVRVGKAAARVTGATRGTATREARGMHSACVRAEHRLPQTNSVRQQCDK